MDGQILMGRQLTVVFAEENRKKPTDMRQRERIFIILETDLDVLTIAGGHLYRATPAHHRHATLFPAPTAVNTPLLQSESNTRGRFLPERKDTVEKGYTHNLRSRSRSPLVERSPPPYNRSRSPIRSPVRDRDQRGTPRDQSRSPVARGGYSRGEADLDVSPSP
uniref:RRM domain-containing protein n=1 Tax=Lactuca sativa TaxID=4236 RepID=A0A9R1XPE4_LACSA|nr:hypothetical protein LSAT_V11C200068980 [Lactuca sativa]